MFRRPPVSIRTVPLLPYTTLCRSLLELLGLRVLTGLGAHEQVGEPRTGAAEVPDVHDRGSQLDVAHALAPDLRAGDLDAAALADDALDAHPLVLSAVALPVLGRTDRKSVVAGKSVSVRVDLGGRRIIKKKK